MSSELPVSGSGWGSKRGSRRAEQRQPEDMAVRVQQLAEENERLFREVARGERRFRRLARAVWHVQEEEHRRIARELHDGIGQLLVAIKERLRVLSQGDLDASVVDDVNQCMQMTAEALDQTRELSRLLRPTVLDDLGLEPALRWLVRTLRARSGLEVELSSTGVDGRLHPDVETLVFRVVQEALTNVLKHSGVLAATVDLVLDGDQLEVVIQDQGCGFQPERVLPEFDDQHGLGLRGIQDRVGLVGGRTKIESVPGEGTTLRARIPAAQVRSTQSDPERT